MTIRVWVQTFSRSRFLRIVIIGGIGFLLQTFVFEVLGIYLHLVSLSTAAILGAELGVLTNFSLNERFSFKDRIAHDSPLTPRLVRFHIIVTGSLCIQWTLMYFAEHHTQNVLVLHGAYISGVMLGFISNYIGYHLFVWKHRVPQE